MHGLILTHLNESQIDRQGELLEKKLAECIANGINIYNLPKKRVRRIFLILLNLI